MFQLIDKQCPQINQQLISWNHNRVQVRENEVSTDENSGWPRKQMSSLSPRAGETRRADNMVLRGSCNDWSRDLRKPRWACHKMSDLSLD